MEKSFQNALDFLNSQREKMKPLIEEGKQRIKELFPKIKDELIPTLEQFLTNLVSGTNKNVHYLTVEELDMKTLVEKIKKHIVPGSNEAAVLRTKDENKIFIYVTFSKDRDLLPDEQNKYIVIEATSLDSDVESLFEETDLVILN